MSEQTEEQARSIGKRANELNAAIRYTMWSVFRLARPLGDDQRTAAADEAQALLDELAGKDVVVRGVYDVAGLRADADVMVWWHSETAEALQEAYTRLRRTTLGRHLDPVWSQMALHRPAEFNRSHIPAFLADEEPRRWVCVYPFVRSYEWYLLPTRSAARCSPSTGRWPAAFPTSAPTRSPRSRSATTSGCWPSRPTSCTASSTSCASCAPRPRAGTSARRCRSTPASASRCANSSPTCPEGAQPSAGTRVIDTELMQ